MIDVSIIIPTFRRPALLGRALGSCLAQERVAPERCEIVVVDNCPQGSARAVVTDLAARAPITVLYLQEPQPGISAARNAGLREARGRFVAFIDDDEAACPDWLRRLLDAQAEFNADIVLGPVLPDLELAAGDPRAPFFRDFFTYATAHPTGTEIGSGILTPFWARGSKAYPRLASGNALIRREVLGGHRFDPRLGLTGGEDTVFFNQLLADGARIVWCAEAVAREVVPTERLNLGFAIRRAFRGGQITSRTPLLLTSRRPALTGLSMLLGALQLAAHLPVAVATATLRHPRRFRHYAAIAQALGKLLWMPPFRRPAYGAATSAVGEASDLEAERAAR